jgi:hypothetical protein
MRVAFTADEGGFTADEHALVRGVAGGGRWLTFQRNAEDFDEDRGIHLEYNGQASGDFGCVAACRLGPESLSVDLGRPLGALAGVTGFDVALRVGPERWLAVRDGLRRALRGHLDVLAEAGPGAAARPGRGRGLSRASGKVVETPPGVRPSRSGGVL